MQLHGNTILITGGGTGIGLSMAQAFAERGNRVAICGRRQEKLDAACKQVPGLAAYCCDIGQAAQRQELFDALRRDGFEINILINNAAIMRPFDLTRPEQLDHTALEHDLRVNFLGPIELTHLFLPSLRKQPNATIINITSPGGVVPVAYFPMYCASKAALNSFTRSLRYQLDGEVKVVLAFPPSVDTAMMRPVDLKTIPPDAFTKGLFAALAKDRDEIWVGEGKFLYWLDRIAPRWTHRFINRSTVVSRSS